MTPTEPEGDAPRGDDRKQDRKLLSYLRFSSAGMQLCVAAGLGTLLGWWLDRMAGLSPLFLILGCFLGFGAGTYTLYRELFGRKR
jgi:F0F1-type ATP synthase assembly protein I